MNILLILINVLQRIVFQWYWNCIVDGQTKTFSNKIDWISKRTLDIIVTYAVPSVPGTQNKKIKTETDALPASSRTTPPPRFKVPTTSDSDEEGNSEELQRLRNENAALRKKLKQAEGKFVLMASTMSKVHGLIDPLIRTLQQSRYNSQKIGSVCSAKD